MEEDILKYVSWDTLYYHYLPEIQIYFCNDGWRRTKQFGGKNRKHF